MRAVFINEHGGTDKLVYGDRPDPEPGPGEVMLSVGASALNHLDLNLREGRTYNGPLPRIMGCDIAGEVMAISPAAHTTLRVGDRVILNNRVTCGRCQHCGLGNDQWCPNQKRLGVDLDGGHADYITAPAVNAHIIPDDMTFAEAASLPIAAHTAWHCLVTQAQIKPWDDVLVQAAGSGVGSMGIQIAKMMGARVITTAGSQWKLETAMEWGADEVINYRETPNFSERVKELTGGQGVDLVFDCVGADVWEQNLLSLKDRRPPGHHRCHFRRQGRPEPVAVAGQATAPDGQRRPQQPHLRGLHEGGAQRLAAGHPGPGVPAIRRRLRPPGHAGPRLLRQDRHRKLSMQSWPLAPVHRDSPPL